MVILRCKVVLVGDATVGKTALVNTFMNGPTGYPKNYIMTPGCEIHQKQISVSEGSATVELQIFDTSGQVIYKDITSAMVTDIQYQHANVVVLAYDISNEDSFKSLNAWLRSVRDSLREFPFIGVVVATKCDMTDRIAVRPQEGASFARGNGFEFFESSAVRYI
jgi:transport family protein 27